MGILLPNVYIVDILRKDLFLMQDNAPHHYTLYKQAHLTKVSKSLGRKM